MLLSSPQVTVGRRERNKQAKLDRITAAAGELFAEHGVDEVTTQQIADKADIGTGTLFLYAKTKGELLLLVQNSALRGRAQRGRGRRVDHRHPGGGDGDRTPVVECNRTQVDNGRTYLREMVFGDPRSRTTPRRWHRRRTEEAVADILADRASLGHHRVVDRGPGDLGHHVRDHGGRP